jgi:hypothetical protein
MVHSPSVEGSTTAEQICIELISFVSPQVSSGRERSSTLRRMVSYIKQCPFISAVDEEAYHHNLVTRSNRVFGKVSWDQASSPYLEQVGGRPLYVAGELS